MLDTVIVTDGVGVVLTANGAFGDRRLSVTAWNVEYVNGLAEAGKPASKCGSQFLPFFDGQAKMTGSRSQVRMVQIIGFDAGFHERPHQRAEHVRIVVDAA